MSLNENDEKIHPSILGSVFSSPLVLISIYYVHLVESIQIDRTMCQKRIPNSSEMRLS